MRKTTLFAATVIAVSSFTLAASAEDTAGSLNASSGTFSPLNFQNAIGAANLSALDAGRASGSFATLGGGLAGTITGMSGLNVNDLENTRAAKALSASETFAPPIKP